MAHATETESVDVLIVGSGPAGSAYARTIADARPDATILMVEVGPKLSGDIGEHTAKMGEAERLSSQLASPGSESRVGRPQLDFSQALGQSALGPDNLFIWPGLFVVG